MTRTFFTIAATCVMATAALGSAGSAAAAAPSGNTSVEQTVRELRSQGYTVRLNGTRNGPLTRCNVVGVRGLSDGPRPATVYVDLSCPQAYLDD